MRKVVPFVEEDKADAENDRIVKDLSLTVTDLIMMNNMRNMS